MVYLLIYRNFDKVFQNFKYFDVDNVVMFKILIFMLFLLFFKIIVALLGVLEDFYDKYKNKNLEIFISKEENQMNLFKIWKFSKNELLVVGLLILFYAWFISFTAKSLQNNN